MKLYISGSNRKENCYKIMQDLKSEEDLFISLADKAINYCMGCNACQETGECTVEDDMMEIYEAIEKVNSIIVASPIYFNQITGILKTVIDRLNPYTVNDKLKGKKLYLITVGGMPESENIEVVKNISNYFREICDIFECEFVFLRNFTTEKENIILDNYNKHDYEQIIQDLKKEIE